MFVSLFFGFVTGVATLLAATLVVRGIKDGENVDTWVTSLFVSLAIVSQAGLVTSMGYDGVILKLIGS